jgi:hypothetical protein
MLKQRASALFHRLWSKGLMRSGMVTGLILAVVVAGLGVAYYEHGRGNLHKLEAKIVVERQDAPVPRPGGKEPVVLMRSRLVGDTAPEFTSVTTLPGRGMNILQITAYIPDKGAVNLLASPSPADAELAMTGKGGDANGHASLAMGGAFEVPWAGRIWGTAQPGGRVTENWRGHIISLPAAAGAGSEATGGLLLTEPASSSSTAGLPDGGQAQAVFPGQAFAQHWPSKTEVTVSVLLSSHTIEFTVVARNSGDVAEPVGIGWRPRFAIAKADREHLLLRIPGERREELREREGSAPTGNLLPVAGTPYDFTRVGGAPLGRMALDDGFTLLHQDLVEAGPIVQLSDPANSYGLRMTVLSPAIKTIHVLAPADADFVSIDPRFNYDDPFGREWSKQPDTGMVVLEPGQSTQWKVRLEIVPLAAGGSSK